VCVRRGEGGRWAKGESGNPKGRKPLSPIARLIEAAREVGAGIVITVPATAEDTPPVPPVTR
jgi:hypothetical protein